MRFSVGLLDEIVDADRRGRLAIDIATDMRVLANVLPIDDLVMFLERSEWPQDVRTRFAHRIQDTLEYERLSEEAAARLRMSLGHLRGAEDAETFIDFVLRSDTWELAESREERIGLPNPLRDAAILQGTRVLPVGRIRSPRRNQFWIDRACASRFPSRGFRTG